MATIVGTPGIDTLEGTDKADTIRGLAGEDYINGAAGSDRLEGGRDADEILGGKGDDLLLGFGGDDVLIAQEGADILRGGDGEDTLYTDGAGFSPTVDYAYGGPGNDVIYGEDGDRLFGGPGDDYFNRVTGSDITGGPGDDVFFFDGLGSATYKLEFGTARVRDFGDGDDRIGLSLSTETKAFYTPQVFDRLDSNNDKKLTKADFAVYVRQGNLVLDIEKAFPGLSWATGAHTLQVDDHTVLLAHDFGL